MKKQIFFVLMACGIAFTAFCGDIILSADRTRVSDEFKNVKVIFDMDNATVTIFIKGKMHEYDIIFNENLPKEIIGAETDFAKTEVFLKNRKHLEVERLPMDESFWLFDREAMRVKGVASIGYNIFTKAFTSLDDIRARTEWYFLANWWDYNYGTLVAIDKGEYK